MFDEATEHLYVPLSLNPNRSFTTVQLYLSVVLVTVQLRSFLPKDTVMLGMLLKQEKTNIVPGRTFLYSRYI